MSLSTYKEKIEDEVLSEFDEEIPGIPLKGVINAVILEIILFGIFFAIFWILRGG